MLSTDDYTPATRPPSPAQVRDALAAWRTRASMNPAARATPIDWPNVNRVARTFVDGAGVGDLFTTVDADFHTADLGTAEHDLEDDRTARTPWNGVFQVFMLIQTKEGAAWRKDDFRTWLSEAGFASVTFEDTPTPSTLVWARP